MKTGLVVLTVFFVSLFSSFGYCLYREDVDYKQVKEAVEKSRREAEYKLRQETTGDRPQAEVRPAPEQAVAEKKPARPRPISKIGVFWFAVLVVIIGGYLWRRKMRRR